MSKYWMIGVQVLLLAVAGYTAWAKPHWADWSQWGRNPEDLHKSYHKAYFDNGQLQLEGWMHQEEKSGWWSSYYSTGQLKTQGEYAKGDTIGTWTFYDSTGSIREVKVF
ncbi:hypothetical protein KFE98_14050 [bacterium SCSIO 12741]|nr:hypothetical protein KFE98_14050 [bacterium SCSIO 12741]